MVVSEASFSSYIVGPYGLFRHSSGKLMVGREVEAPSDSSEVLSLLSDAPRFRSKIWTYSFNEEYYQYKVYAYVDVLSFSDDDVYDSENLLTSMLCFLDFMFDAGDYPYLAQVNYSSIQAYVFKLMLKDTSTERLMLDEGYRL